LHIEGESIFIEFRKMSSPTAIPQNTLPKLHLITDYPQNGGTIVVTRKNFL